MSIFDKIITVITAPFTLPFKVVEAIGLGGAIDAVKDIQVFPYRMLVQIGAQAAGAPGKLVAEIALGGPAYSIELATQIAHAAGGNPVELLASPVAAAMKAAADEFRSISRPVPPEVVQRLGPHFPAEVLARARYCVGYVGLNLPEVLNGSNKIFGRDNAVTVDDVIVFAREPGVTYGDLHWWAHELTHVEQYARWGVPAFALKYVTAWGEIESEAEQRAEALFPFNHDMLQIGASVVFPGQGFMPNQFVDSPGGAYRLVMQPDNNLVLYGTQTQPWTAVWASNTVESGAVLALMQGDGNFVLYDKDLGATQEFGAKWSSGTVGHPGAYLAVQADGRLVIYEGQTPIWRSN